MKILVTGASGFLGRHLCAALERRGDDVLRVNSRNHDLRVSGALDSVKGSFDLLFHLAAWTQAGDFCLSHAGEQWWINQQINTTMLRWWSERQPQAKLVSMGTSCAYDPALPLKEENYLVGSPIADLFTYAQTKRMLHIGQQALHSQYEMTYLTLVPSTLYGPEYHTDGRQMHFIFDLIRKILSAKANGGAVALWGDGHQRRELVLVDDFVETALRLAASADNDLINIGAGEEYSIREFAESICVIVGYDSGLIQYDTSKYVGAKSKFLDTSKLDRLLPGRPRTTLQEGLKRTIAWFERQ